MARPIHTLLLWRPAITPHPDRSPVRDCVDVVLIAVLAFLAYVIIYVWRGEGI